MPEAEKSVQWAVTMVSQSIYSATYLWNATGRKTSAAVLADEILCFLMAGLKVLIEKE